ncbi:uncharacterized protein K452DRAFT_286020, partial [Aplosporella prunicola CBS 121167]
MPWLDERSGAYDCLSLLACLLLCSALLCSALLCSVLASFKMAGTCIQYLP